eukprot:GILK01011148.1.p1 GENE.GILK01011148.1~~GILK01011148.1.p1  ORF type:complete len:557 (+),score=53.29 GILK01011148.1:60-1673(+)
MATGTQDLDTTFELEDEEQKESPSVPVVTWGKLMSLNPSKASNILLDKDNVTIGRRDENDAVIADARVSSNHCSVSRVTETKDGVPVVSFVLCDVSSNGTFVNGKKVGKNMTIALKNGDEVVLLPESKVGKPDLLGYVFKTLKRTHSEVTDPGDEPDTKKTKLGRSDTFTESMLEDLTCSICTEVIYRCVAAIPCLHNFCGACLSDWLARSPDCPKCRQSVTEVHRNHTLNNVVSTFLSAHAEYQRPDDEKKALDLKDKITADAVPISALNSSVKPVRVASVVHVHYDDDDDEVSDEYRDPEHRADDDMYDDEMQASDHYEDEDEDEEEEDDGCPHCTAPAADGFQCGESSTHEVCSYCLRPFPKRPNADNIQCVGCKSHFCEQYWGTCQRKGPMTNFCKLSDHTFAALPANVLASNPYERQLLVQVLTDKGKSVQDLFQEMLVQLDANNWSYPFTNRGLGGVASSAVKSDSYLCSQCAAGVFLDLCYRYRQSLDDDELPAEARNRSNCWYGKNCRTQTHNINHAKRLNHICEQTRH